MFKCCALVLLPSLCICAISFCVNIGPNEQEITMHMNPRFDAHGDQNAVVCNSYEGGNWCEEHREGGFPFQQGEEFTVRPVCLPHTQLCHHDSLLVTSAGQCVSLYL